MNTNIFPFYNILEYFGIFWNNWKVVPEQYCISVIFLWTIISFINNLIILFQVSTSLEMALFEMTRGTSTSQAVWTMSSMWRVTGWGQQRLKTLWWESWPTVLKTFCDCDIKQLKFCTSICLSVRPCVSPVHLFWFQLNLFQMVNCHLVYNQLVYCSFRLEAQPRISRLGLGLALGF